MSIEEAEAEAVAAVAVEETGAEATAARNFAAAPLAFPLVALPLLLVVLVVAVVQLPAFVVVVVVDVAVVVVTGVAVPCVIGVGVVVGPAVTNAAAADASLGNVLDILFLLLDFVVVLAVAGLLLLTFNLLVADVADVDLKLPFDIDVKSSCFLIFFLPLLLLPLAKWNSSAAAFECLAAMRGPS